MIFLIAINFWDQLIFSIPLLYNIPFRNAFQEILGRRNTREHQKEFFQEIPGQTQQQ